MTASSMFVLCGTALAVAVYGVAEYQSRQNVITVGFWVDESVTFDLPHLSRRGGPLSAAERERLVAVARDEIAAAFAGLRVRVSERRDAFYRVRVLQILTWRRAAVSGQSNVFGPLGGAGAVSFETLASQAIARAPDGTGRPAIVEAIGRGLGRAAVHEFAHQFLPKVALHASTDEQSYEYWNSNRAAQFYGPMRWDVARDHLRRRFGSETVTAAPVRQSEEADDDRTTRAR
jgi:hypothetical protein